MMCCSLASNLKEQADLSYESHCSIRSFPILYWEYHGIQAFMFDLWMHSYSMQQSYQQDVEASFEEVKEASLSLC